MKRRAGRWLAVAMLVAAVWSPSPANAIGGTTARATSAQPNGATPATSVADTTSPALALDGLVTAFSSDASNLVSGDTNGVSDVFVRDLVKGRVVRASIGIGGAQANGASWDPSLSVDGRYLAFVSKATNIVPGDANGFADVFLRDLAKGRTQLVSVASSGAQSDGDSAAPFVSLFGRWVTFDSAASNLSTYDDNGLADAFVRDTTKRRTTRVEPPEWDPQPSTIAGETPPSTQVRIYTQHAQISYDGRFLSFTRGAQRTTPASALANDPSPTPVGLDTYVVDRKTNTTTQIPAPPYIGHLPGGVVLRCRPMSDHASLSANGQDVAFESWSACEYDSTLIKNPVANTLIYRFDIQHPQSLSLISLNTWGQVATGGGAEGTQGDSTRPSISANGAVIAFQSDAVNLVPGDTNGKTDIFVRDLGARTTSRISMNDDGTEGNQPSLRPSISYEGRRIAFASSASNLVSGDTNGTSDAFVTDRQNFYQNHAPALTAPVHGTRKVNALEHLTLQLHARDTDGDAVRYGVILWRASNGTSLPSGQLPDGATIDPVTGKFDWTPMPPMNPDAPHQNACGWCEVKVQIVFWVGDARGNSDVKLAEFTIRDAQATAQCKSLGQCGT